MSNRIKIAVVILNWNGEKFLRKFLVDVIEKSTIDGIDSSIIKVIVADNGSSDGSIGYLESINDSRLEIIKFEKNYGYTGGYNKAIDMIDAEYCLLLNSDIEVTDNYLSPLFDLLQSNSNIAAAQPKILTYDNPTHFEYAGACGGFIDILGYPFCRGRLINSTETDHGQYDNIREIFWASGAALFIRTSDYKEIGGLDEFFFAHMEEIDLCWRLKRSGKTIMVAPKSVVYHVGGGTLPAWSPQKTYLNFRNNIAMLYKNLSWPMFLIVLMIRICTDFLRAFSYMISGQFKFASAIFRGHIDFWKNRKKLNRQNYLGHKHVSQIYCGSIVLRYLFNKNFDNIM